MPAPDFRCDAFSTKIPPEYSHPNRMLLSHWLRFAAGLASGADFVCGFWARSVGCVHFPIDGQILNR
jgi:hypothetical protein